ncbi:MAG: PilW family protein [Xanthomonadales bacterium]
MNASRQPHRECSTRGASGMTLLELLVAVSITAILLLGLVRFATAAGLARQLQDSQSQLQDQARVAFRMLADAIAEAGFDPAPWRSTHSLDGAFTGSADAVTTRGDRLVVRTWSDRNCFDNLNPVTGVAGRPAFFLRESAFDLSAAGQLTRSCRYGPTAGELTTQVRRQGKVPGIDSFQLLFGIDGDGDGNADRWVHAGEWDDPGAVLGVRVGLLLRGAEPVVEPVARGHAILDQRLTAPADGHLRLPLEFTAAVRGRTG